MDLALNDPGRFRAEQPHIIVTLDDACRRQQVGKDGSHRLTRCPRAISMSVRQILKSREIVCVVPDARKAEAVRICVEATCPRMAPASILRTYANTTLYLDADSAALLKTGELRRDPLATSHENRASGAVRSSGERVRRHRFQLAGLTANRVDEALQQMRATA